MQAPLDLNICIYKDGACFNCLSTGYLQYLQKLYFTSTVFPLLPTAT